MRYPGEASAPPRLIISGRSAEHPSPARANVAAPRPGADGGTSDVRTKASAIAQGRSLKVTRAGTQRSMAAKTTRPAVVAAQNSVKAAAARPADARTTP